MKTLKRIFGTLLIILTLSSCGVIGMRQTIVEQKNKEYLIKRANSYCAQFGQPDEVSNYDNDINYGGDESLTYIYYCYKGMYIVVDVTYDNISVFKSKGICDK